MLLPFLRGWAMDEKTRLARLRGEQDRPLLNTAARTELPNQQWWLSFAGDDGFHGVAIVHATGFTEALMVAEVVEDEPMWGENAPSGQNVIMLPPSTSCSTPLQRNGVPLPPKVPVTDPLSKSLAARINKVKNKLLNSGKLTSAACQTFFNNDPDRAQWFSQLTTAVNNQIQYDGSLSTINHYDAGLWDDGLQGRTALLNDMKRHSVACDFEIVPEFSDGHIIEVPKGVVPDSQIKLPATDVYYTADPLELSEITPSTILHEALHNLLWKTDDDVR